MENKEYYEKMYNLMKVMVGLLIAILGIVVIGVALLSSNNGAFGDTTNTNTSETENTEYDVSMFKEIKASDIKTETKGKLSVIYVGRSTCGWCVKFLPSLVKAQEEFGYKTLYIDIAKIIDFANSVISDEDAYETMVNLTGDEYDGYMKENFGSTPMVLIVKDGKIVGAQTGYSEYETFKNVLKDVGIK